MYYFTLKFAVSAYHFTPELKVAIPYGGVNDFLSLEIKKSRAI